MEKHRWSADPGFAPGSLVRNRGSSKPCLQNTCDDRQKCFEANCSLPLVLRPSFDFCILNFYLRRCIRRSQMQISSYVDGVGDGLVGERTAAVSAQTRYCTGIGYCPCNVPSSGPASAALVLATWCGAALCSDRLSGEAGGNAGGRRATCRMILQALLTTQAWNVTSGPHPQLHIALHRLMVQP